ncbi:MAG: 4Fe-4S dicluster domain-containing protein [Clostridia bacterium]|jgi:formate dehydrogenase iron-sulfur subunit|nr:4Fe-4S dicluster domain-containing protein [Clostridia bacterium]
MLELTRRNFVKLTGIIGLTAATASVSKIAQGEEKINPETSKGMLIDISKCIGCKMCVTACQNKNGFPENPQATDLSPESWTYVKPVNINKGSEELQRNVKQQCLHCVNPSCASACLVGALVKTNEGAVNYEAWRCIGCRYCMIACPFNIPRYQWDKLNPFITKCLLCYDKLLENEQPACASQCPVKAITFGNRVELISYAEKLIKEIPDKYVPHIYGKSEVGGTAIMYIADIPFADLNFKMDLGTTPKSDYTDNVLAKVPAVAGGLGTILTLSYFLTRYYDKNQIQIQIQEKKEGEEDEK